MSNHATPDYAPSNHAADQLATATPIFDELRDEIGIDLADLLPQTSDEKSEGTEIRAVG
jgi:hypothetical protein